MMLLLPLLFTVSNYMTFCVFMFFSLYALSVETNSNYCELKQDFLMRQLDSIDKRRMDTLERSIIEKDYKSKKESVSNWFIFDFSVSAVGLVLSAIFSLCVIIEALSLYSNLD